MHKVNYSPATWLLYLAPGVTMSLGKNAWTPSCYTSFFRILGVHIPAPAPLAPDEYAYASASSSTEMATTSTNAIGAGQHQDCPRDHPLSPVLFFAAYFHQTYSLRYATRLSNTFPRLASTRKGENMTSQTSTNSQEEPCSRTIP